MHRKTRRLVDILKELLEDDSIPSEGERAARWMSRTSRSRPRYYYYLKIALSELAEVMVNCDEKQSGHCET